MKIGLLVLPTRVGHGRDNLEALLAAITAAAGTCIGGCHRGGMHPTPTLPCTWTHRVRWPSN